MVGVFVAPLSTPCLTRLCVCVFLAEFVREEIIVILTTAFVAFFNQLALEVSKPCAQAESAWLGTD